MKNILDYIEQTARLFPDRIAVADENTYLCYHSLLDHSKKIGSYLTPYSLHNKPIAIYMDKTPDLVAAMLGVVYSGNFYVVLDSKMPAARVNRIFETLQPKLVLTDESHRSETAAFSFDQAQVHDLEFKASGDTGSDKAPVEHILLYEDAMDHVISQKELDEIRSSMSESDPLYALYTSGSTGQPKGTVISHHSVIAYSDWVISTFDINEMTVFGSQTPFYFSMSVTDLFSTLRTGARLQIIPKSMFSFPLMLMDYLDKEQINTIYWVPSALCIVANWDTFTYHKPAHLKKILFAGEVMPNKQLNYWRRHLPDAFFANLFGPTETTDICTYYVVDRTFSDAETLPIGRACDNCTLLILDENGHPGEKGELLVGGPFLADGYYNNPEKTAAAFVQNPCNKAYPEIMYRTGDLVATNEYGELIYLGRKDFQVKHMGYRIELGEIEAAAGALCDVNACVCLYDSQKDILTLVYQGKAREDHVINQIQKSVPPYMLPNKVIKIKQMLYNANGKIDRKLLSSKYSDEQVQ